MCFVKKGVLKISSKFTGKHLCSILYLNNVAGLRCFPMFNYWKGLYWALKLEQGFASTWMSVELMLKQLLFFYKFYDFICRGHSLMNWQCYNNLFQSMQHDSFWNLNSVVFTRWKHLKSRVNAIWYCFPVIKRYTFHYMMKSAPIPGN